MWIFNRLAQQMDRTNLTFVLAGMTILLTTTACQLPKPGQREDGAGGASFTVTSVDGKPQKEKLAGTFKLPVSRIYNMKACLKDFARSTELSGQRFEIPEIDLSVTTDIGGCLNWSETVEFNDLATPAYLKFERTIKGTGMARGERVVEFAISPWAHGEDPSEAIDLSRNKISNLVDDPKEVQLRRVGNSTNENLNVSPIWLENIQLKATDERLKNNKLSLVYEVRGVPELLLTKLNGEKTERAFRAGRFHAQLQLVVVDVANGGSENNTEAKTVLASSVLKNQNLRHGELILRFPVLTAIPNSGQLMVALRLAPVDAPTGLKSFEGLYRLGDYRALKSGGSLTQSEVVADDPDFSISKYLGAADHGVGSSTSNSNQSNFNHSNSNQSKPNGATSNGESASGNSGNTSATPGHLSDATIHIEHLVFRAIGGNKGSTLEQDFTYAVTACFISTVDQQPLRSRKVKITGSDAVQIIQNHSDTHGNNKGSQSSIEPITNVSGCTTWIENLNYKVYDCKRYLPRSVTFEIVDLGWKGKVDYFVNPWPIAVGTFAIDKRNAGTNFESNLRCDPGGEGVAGNKNAGRIELAALTYTTDAYRYDIDHHLNLSIKKRIDIQIAAPTVANKSNLDYGLSMNEPLRDGPYLLKLLILRNPDYATESPYVSHTSAIVSVSRGQIEASLEVSTRNLKSWLDRNRLYVELHPVAPNKVKNMGDDSYAPLSPQTDVDSLIQDSLIQKDSPLVVPTFTGLITLGRGADAITLTRVDSFAQTGFITGSSGLSTPPAPSTSLPTSSIVAAPAALIKTQEGGSILSRLLKESLESKLAQSQNQTNPVDIEKWAASANLLWINSSSSISTNFLKAMKVPEVEYHSYWRSNLWSGTTAFWTPLRDKSNPMTVPDFRQILTTGLTPELAHQLCIAWTQELLGSSLMPRYAVRFAARCKAIVESDPQQFFQVLRQSRVHKLGSSRFVRGHRRDFSVGHAFNVNRTSSESIWETRTVSAGAKLPDFYGIGVGGSYSISWNAAEDWSVGHGFSAREGVALIVEESVYELDVESSETCATIRLNPELFKRPARNMIWQRLQQFFRAPMVSYLRQDLSEKKKAEALSRGLMVCSGRSDQGPVQLTEKYYLIYQDIGNTVSFDNGNINNQFLFMSIRGERDFLRFIRAARGKAVMSHDTQAEDADFNEFELLLKQFYLPVPTVPGLIQN